MDSLNKKLLTMIQDDFPICSRPYETIGKKLGIDEKEVIDRIKDLKQKGIIRRLGGVFDSRKLGYKSTLCTMEVPSNRLEEVVKVVNSYTGVTHNYLREHKYNLWFTLITPTEDFLHKVITQIEKTTNLKVYNLPALRLFKINVKFKVPGISRGEEKNAQSYG